MKTEKRSAIHADFRLIEREEPEDRQTRQVRDILRTAWTLPLDTYVTHDIPTLLTMLCVPDGKRAGGRASEAADTDVPSASPDEASIPDGRLAAPPSGIGSAGEG